jgi:hypothetical protein
MMANIAQIAITAGGKIEFIGFTIGSAGAINDISTSNSNLSTLSGAGQLIGAIVGVTPLGAIATAPTAAMITIVKIGVDVQKTGTVSVGDVLNVVGNGVALVGGITVLAGISTPVVGLAIAGVVIGTVGFIASNQGWTIDTTISPTLGTTPDPLVKTIRYVDPLILDLDGDGLEITRLSKGVLFDADGDTIKTGTAWAGADDGMLVWDRNNNGLIDSGRELFGDETILANGKKATHGFAALKELDTNQDNIFDNKDALYNTVKVWRDLNQDGISQTNELSGLNKLNIFYYSTL